MVLELWCHWSFGRVGVAEVLSCGGIGVAVILELQWYWSCAGVGVVVVMELLCC